MLIGVFHPRDPFAVMPEGRVRALVAEAARQKVQLIFFQEDGIDLDTRTIRGLVYGESQWVETTTPFPASVMNVRPWGPRKRSPKELIFRRLVPFTAFLIGDKWEMTEKLAQNDQLAPYIVPTVLLEQIETAEELLRTYDKAVLKPASGSRGAGIMALSRDGSDFLLQKGADVQRLTRNEFAQFITGLRKNYLIQPYIRALTPDGEPFDFRVLVQRDAQGRWAIPVIYPRIGTKGTITSNVSVGGQTELLEHFLARVMPRGRYTIPGRLRELGLLIARTVNDLYDFPINELGIDIAIDDRDRVWFYEANTCPGTLNHEVERAPLAIAYACRVGADSFNLKQPISRPRSGNQVIGLLFGSLPSDAELAPFELIAKSYGVTLAVMLALDVKADLHSGEEGISAYIREEGAWVKRAIEPPDTTYCLLHREDAAETAFLFNERHRLPLTSSAPPGQVPASVFLALIARSPRLLSHFPEHLIPTTSHDAKGFIDAHERVVMKAGNESEEEEALLVHRLQSSYEVIESRFVHRFNASEMRAFLALFDKTSYMLIKQTDSQITGSYPLHLRVHLTKSAEGWHVLHIAPFVALKPLELPTNAPAEVDWDWLLYREFGENGDAMDELVRKLSGETAALLETFDYRTIHEVIVDFGLDADRRLWLLGAEYGGPYGQVHTFDIASHVLPYVLSRQGN
ncbi:YheC/YheD family protein [Paenibacillus methanolicus]|uniref:YheC/D-like protein n=1 Tax=Paenibacillus methanolicus TaxID=582686 RepID=A0A5S5C6Q1_9BACL|nr:YheC/YheD family protein [Paenibacillus methanolicus]TYP74152.1 YheC/D-like protein [Paenibacillus methanolicus]